MESGLEEIPFSRIFRIEQLKQIQHEAVIDKCLGDIGVEILALDEPQEEFVHHLNMRPSHLKHRFVFLGVKGLTLRVHGWWDGSEQVLREHVNNAGIHLLRDDLAIIGNIIEQLV